jgi:hypothetical protein
MAGFTAELVGRVQQRFGENPQAAEIFDFTKEVALESFKAGLAASRKKSAWKRKSAPAYIKGSALGNRKLNPVRTEA